MDIMLKSIEMILSRRAEDVHRDAAAIKELTIK